MRVSIRLTFLSTTLGFVSNYIPALATRKLSHLNCWRLWTGLCIILTFGACLYVHFTVSESRTHIWRLIPEENYNSELQKELLKSEMEWRSAQAAKELENPNLSMNKSTFWNHFPASFPCPYRVERVGKDGDGGKGICGFSEIKKLAKCTVYSFGINNEVTFEQMILEQTKCTIRMFDIIKVRPNPAAVLTQFPGRISYSDTGISDTPNNTLKAIMDRHQDSYIDILKMDIEWGEWQALSRAVTDFPDGLPISQLSVEIHFEENLKPRQEYLKFRNWLKMLDHSGLRPFYKEPNPFHPLHLYEYSFLGLKFGMFRLH